MYIETRFHNISFSNLNISSKKINIEKHESLKPLKFEEPWQAEYVLAKLN